MAAAANSNFSLAVVDKRAAFLLSKVLDRDDFVKPPKTLESLVSYGDLRRPYMS